MSVQPAATTRRRARSIALRGVVALGLIGDSVVHLHLAPLYQEASADGVGLGNLFRLEAVVAIAAAAYVVVRGSRRAYAVAFVVAVSAVLAVFVSRYVDLPPFGPLPAMYEPIWYPEKAISAVAEGVAAVGAAAALLRIEIERRASVTRRDQGSAVVRNRSSR